ncbi:hypothetical protein PG984_003799 [Apiospora sp. TS-2023a]
MASSSSSSSSSQPTDGRSSLLTFGIEMEFVVAYMPEGMADPHPGDRRNVYIGGAPPDYRPIPTDEEIHTQYDYIYRSALERGIGEEEAHKQATSFILDVNPRNRQRYGDEDHPEAWAHIRYRMARLLRDHNIVAISDSNDKVTNDYIEETPLDARRRMNLDIDEDDPPGIDYGYWDVNIDASVGESLTKEYLWAPIEITSPVLYYNQESLELIRFVVNLLQSEFRILINETMMFHVHVGRGAQGFSFTELQAITAFLYAAAPRLDQLHPIWCGPLALWAPGPRPHSLMANLDKKEKAKAKSRREVAGPTNPLLTTETYIEQKGRNTSRTLTPYQNPMTRLDAHEMLQQWKGHQRAHAFGAARIWETRTLEELYDCLSTVYLDRRDHSWHYRPAYNFRNLVARKVVKKTIEFRQHCGTLSPEAIVNWVSVAAGLCNFCVNSPFHESLSPVMRKLEHLDPNSAESWRMNNLPRPWIINTTSLLYGRPGDPYSVYDLLRDVGLAPQAEYYQKRGLHSLPPDFFVIRDRNKDDYGLPPARGRRLQRKSGSTGPGGGSDKPEPETAG